MNGNERYAPGTQRLAEVNGEAGRKVISALQDVAPDLGRYVIEFGFGDVYSRAGLDLRSRELATVAGLKTLGPAQPHLKVHLHGALNVGCTAAEVVEVIHPDGLVCGLLGGDERDVHGPAGLRGARLAAFAERRVNPGASGAPA